MKFSISHELSYRYDSPVRFSIQYLRLCPRDTARQKVLDWKLETPGRAVRTLDGYGNVLHVLTTDKPTAEMWIHSGGSVETTPALDEPSDFTGTPLSPLLFLRPTALTRVDDDLGRVAEGFRRRAGSLSGLRELAAAIQKKKPGVAAEELTHAFIACCRHVGVPARYVSGYVDSSKNSKIAIHAWAEAWVVDRWRSFDVVHSNAIGEAHIKVAVGADYLDACPVRGVRTGGGVETLMTQAQVTAGNQ